MAAGRGGPSAPAPPRWPVVPVVRPRPPACAQVGRRMQQKAVRPTFVLQLDTQTSTGGSPPRGRPAGVLRATPPARPQDRSRPGWRPTSRRCRCAARAAICRRDLTASPPIPARVAADSTSCGSWRPQLRRARARTRSASGDTFTSAARGRPRSPLDCTRDRTGERSGHVTSIPLTQTWGPRPVTGPSRPPRGKPPPTRPAAC